MKLLVFAASNSRSSINLALATYAANRLKSEFEPKAELTFLDLNDFEMPIYSPDRQKETGIPKEAQSFFDTIGDADAVLVSFAEYNGTVTAAWKNIFDWMSRINMKVWQDKPLVALSATPGGRAGAGVLGYIGMAMPHFGADFRAQSGVGRWAEAWDSDALTLRKPEDIAAIDQALKSLIT